MQDAASRLRAAAARTLQGSGSHAFYGSSSNVSSATSASARSSGSSSSLGSTDSVRTESVHTYYTLGKVLGRGNFGAVYEGVHKITGERVAIKIIQHKAARAGSHDQQIILNEIKILRKICADVNSPYLIRVHEAFEDGHQVHLILNLCTGGELYDRIVREKHFSERRAAGIFRQIMHALKALHSRGIIHRDIKPENILFQTPHDDSDIAITDFGLAHVHGSVDLQALRQVGSPSYVAPEVLQGKPLYTPACDVWSAGVVLYIMLSGIPPFFGNSDKQTFARIKSGHYRFYDKYWHEVSNAAKDLLRKILVVDVDKRLSVDEILKHPWMKQTQRNKHLANAMQNLRQFNARRKLRAAALACVVGGRLGTRSSLASLVGETNFNIGELRRLRKAFFRICGGRETDLSQFNEALHSIGYGDLPSQRIFELFDTNANGLVDYKEFLCGLSTLKGNDEDALRMCFDVYDQDSSGDITFEELAQVLSVVASGDVKADLETAGRLGAIFERLDANQDHVISWEEFRDGIRTDRVLVEAFLTPLNPMAGAIGSTRRTISNLVQSVASSARTMAERRKQRRRAGWAPASELSHILEQARSVGAGGGAGGGAGAGAGAAGGAGTGAGAAESTAAPRATRRSSSKRRATQLRGSHSMDAPVLHSPRHGGLPGEPASVAANDALRHTSSDLHGSASQSTCIIL